MIIYGLWPITVTDSKIAFNSFVIFPKVIFQKYLNIALTFV